MNARWLAGAGEGEAIRLLLGRPWLEGAQAALVLRHLAAVRAFFQGTLRWPVAVEGGAVRLKKSPPVREWLAPLMEAPVASWFWLAVAALYTLPPWIRASDVVAACRQAAGQADEPVTGSATEVRHLREALGELRRRGIVSGRHNWLENLTGEEADAVWLRVDHARLLLVMANVPPLDAWGRWGEDPVADPEAWVGACDRPVDAATRVLRRLVDDTAVLWGDLDAVEAQWLRECLHTRVAETAEVLGLVLEVRSEGVALVAEAGEGLPGTGPALRFPLPGTAHHAALLVRDFVLASEAQPHAPWPGWRGRCEGDVLGELRRLALVHIGWSQELRSRPARLLAEVRALWEGLGLLRVRSGGSAMWWMSPVSARWDRPLTPVDALPFHGQNQPPA
ncbi:DUF2398 family protein [Kitasatospora sp. NPDC091257]|uniref:DUF2398 family protein n=1 Tax=Kitasatospora sp. NPDC091257 TaxID=3364084 RepID=UPI0037FC2712